MPHDRGELVWLEPDALIVGQRNPTTLANRFQPRLLACIRREVILVSFNIQSGRPENVRKLLPEIPVGEKDKAQAAARS